jgi:CheY-like chemotaxis protein
LWLAGSSKLQRSLRSSILILVKTQPSPTAIDLSNVVLVVEDDPDAQTIFADRLTWEGYQVVCVNSGTEAWELLTHGFRPRVVILDVMLPGMEGTELRQRMLRDRTMAEIPIVVVTAISGMIRCVLPNLAAFFRKPVPLDELVDVVARHAKPTARPRPES